MHWTKMQITYIANDFSLVFIFEIVQQLKSDMHVPSIDVYRSEWCPLWFPVFINYIMPKSYRKTLWIPVERLLIFNLQNIDTIHLLTTTWFFTSDNCFQISFQICWTAFIFYVKLGWSPCSWLHNFIFMLYWPFQCFHGKHIDLLHFDSLFSFFKLIYFAISCHCKSL